MLHNVLENRKWNVIANIKALEPELDSQQDRVTIQLFLWKKTNKTTIMQKYTYLFCFLIIKTHFLAIVFKNKEWNLWRSCQNGWKTFSYYLLEGRVFKTLTPLELDAAYRRTYDSSSQSVSKNKQLSMQLKNVPNNTCHLFKQAKTITWWQTDGQTDDGEVIPVHQPAQVGNTEEHSRGNCWQQNRLTVHQ